MNKFWLTAAIALLPTLAYAGKLKTIKFQPVPVDSPLALAALGALVSIIVVRFLRHRR